MTLNFLLLKSLRYYSNCGSFCPFWRFAPVLTCWIECDLPKSWLCHWRSCFTICRNCSEYYPYACTCIKWGEAHPASTYSLFLEAINMSIILGSHLGPVCTFISVFITAYKIQEFYFEFSAHIGAHTETILWKNKHHQGKKSKWQIISNETICS